MNSRNPRRSKLEKGALLFYVLPTELFENYSKNRFEWISKENSALSLTVAARERKVIVQLWNTETEKSRREVSVLVQEELDFSIFMIEI